MNAATLTRTYIDGYVPGVDAVDAAERFTLGRHVDRDRLDALAADGVIRTEFDGVEGAYNSDDIKAAVERGEL